MTNGRSMACEVSQWNPWTVSWETKSFWLNPVKLWHCPVVSYASSYTSVDWDLEVKWCTAVFSAASYKVSVKSATVCVTDCSLDCPLWVHCLYWTVFSGSVQCIIRVVPYICLSTSTPRHCWQRCSIIHVIPQHTSFAIKFVQSSPPAGSAAAPDFRFWCSSQKHTACHFIVNVYSNTPKWS